MNHDNDPFGRSSMPSSCSTREGRVRWLVEVRDILIAHGGPAAMYVAGALGGYLTEGGSLERDHLRITPERGSKLTPAALWHKLHSDEGEPCEEPRESSNDDDDERIEDTNA